MKFLCPVCDRLVELTDFRLEAGALAVRCDRCGGETRVPQVKSSRPAEPARALEPPPPNVVPLRPSAPEAVRLAAEAAAGDPFAVPEGHCPKCIARMLGDDPACRQCGFVFGSGVPESAQPSPTLSEDWRNVLAHWDQVELHDQMLQSAVLRGDLASVGRLYRIRLAHASDDPYAARGRDEVVRLASAGAPAFLVKPPPEADKTAPWKVVVVGVLMVSFIGMFIAMLVNLYRASP